MSREISRREFMVASGAALAVAGARAGVAQPPVRKPQLVLFSKHLQHLTMYKNLAAQCKRLGVDGLDLAVREGAHVLPEKVAEDLPRAVEAMRAEGMEVPMITTRLRGGDDPDARPILEAASKLGIKYVRIGGHRYAKIGDPLARLAACSEDLKKLAPLLDEFDMQAGYHNHSGPLNVGAPVWDLHYLFEKTGSRRIGSNFDLGHAMVEGSFGDWQITAQLMARHVKMLAVKDFVWNGAEPKWVPLGEGIVPVVEMLRVFRASNFAGPVSMHFEYKVRDDADMIERMAKDVETLRKMISDAGYA